MSNIALPKTRTVLANKGTISNPLGARMVRFAKDDEGDEARTYVLDIEEYVWADLGSPAEITVTIKPGDRLNKESP